MTANRIDYHGKRIIVTGAASGMGEAVARLAGELGAEVYALDVKGARVPVATFVKTDLMDRDSIDAAVRGIGGPVHALFNCAGVPGPPFSNTETMLVNFIGPRHLTESVIALMPHGGAIASIASVAGSGWTQNLSNVMRLLETVSFDEAHAWCDANPKIANGYRFSKECMIVYSMVRARELGRRGLRINCVSPGITETPMLLQFDTLVTREWMERHLQGFLGRNSRPEEQAWPLLFVNSDLASFMSGTNTFVDAGYTGSLLTGQVPPAPPPPTAPSAK